MVYSSSSQSTAVGLSVCFVTDTFVPDVNGVAMTLSRLTAGLSARGHRVDLVGPGWPDHDHVCRQFAVKSVRVPTYKDIRLGLATRATFVRLWRQNRPDVVYVATEGLAGLAAVRQARRWGIPVVSGFHTRFHQYSGRYHLGLLKGVTLGYLRALHNRTHCTLVPSEDVRAELSRRGFVNLEVVGRGVDCRLFDPNLRDPELRASWGLDASGLVVIYVGRLAAEKNLELAFRAFRAIQVQRPDARFIVVGDGPSAENLRRDNPDVVFCGMRHGDDLARHYASGDMLLFPSETETFGNVTTEGMASGLGVVAYDYAAAGQHIRSGINGMTAPLGDGDVYIDRALMLATNSGFLSRVRATARGTAKTLSWDAIIHRFEFLLKQSIDCNQKGDRP